jgi:hypothetical protein
MFNSVHSQRIERVWEKRLIMVAQLSKQPLYTPFFCEENIWHLVGMESFGPGWVVFISNPERQVPVWMQRASRAENQPVVWDYHVIALAQGEPQPTIWDLDSRLGCPTKACDYYRHSIFPNAHLQMEMKLLFRLVGIADFRECFSSDRSHMKNKENGDWLAPPPEWGPIVNESGTMNLHSFIDMQTEFLGEVISEQEFLTRFCL